MGESDEIMNPTKLLKMQMAWKQFNETHPKVLPFLKAVETAGIREGTVIEISVETPEGQKFESNIKVQPSDMELLRRMKEER